MQLSVAASIIGSKQHLGAQTVHANDEDKHVGHFLATRPQPRINCWGTGSEQNAYGARSDRTRPCRRRARRVGKKDTTGSISCGSQPVGNVESALSPHFFVPVCRQSERLTVVVHEAIVSGRGIIVVARVILGRLPVVVLLTFVSERGDGIIRRALGSGVLHA